MMRPETHVGLRQPSVYAQSVGVVSVRRAGAIMVSYTLSANGERHTALHLRSP